MRLREDTGRVLCLVPRFLCGYILRVGSCECWHQETPPRGCHRWPVCEGHPRLSGDGLVGEVHRGLRLGAR